MYGHAWLQVVVRVKGKDHTVLIDPTIAMFSADIHEDIAVWHERMPGFKEALIKYEPTYGGIQGVEMAKDTFCSAFMGGIYRHVVVDASTFRSK